MLWRQRLYTIERVLDLEVDRLLGPQRTVVVEGGDPLRERDVIGAALACDAADEIDDGPLGAAFVP